MKIVVLKSSGHTHGSSNLLADAFIRGAKESGHTITEIDVYKANVKPCTGCVACGYEGTCVQRDDMTSIRQNILDSDMIVFVTPLYYYGFSAQLKTVIDRFCAFNGSLTSKQMKSVLITAAWNADDWTFEALETHYKTLVRYLHFKDCGRILGCGCGSVEMTRSSEYPQLANKLGKMVG